MFRNFILRSNRPIIDMVQNGIDPNKDFLIVTYPPNIKFPLAWHL